MINGTGLLKVISISAMKLRIGKTSAQRGLCLSYMPYPTVDAMTTHSTTVLHEVKEKFRSKAHTHKLMVHIWCDNPLGSVGLEGDTWDASPRSQNQRSIWRICWIWILSSQKSKVFLTHPSMLRTPHPIEASITLSV